MKRITTLLYLLLAVFSAAGQEIISGQISQWTVESARIVFVEQMSGELVELGSVSGDGRFSIALPPDFIRKARDMSGKAKEKAPQGWKLSFKDVASTFTCEGEISHQNGEALLAGLPELVLVDKKGNELGVLYAVSSTEMARWFFNYGMDEPVMGYKLLWYYLEEAASATGSCSIETYTGSGEEKFNNITELNVDLKEGWNMVMYHYSESFGSEDGKSFPSKLEINRIETLPQDLQWVVIRF